MQTLDARVLPRAQKLSPAHFRQLLADDLDAQEVLAEHRRKLEVWFNSQARRAAAEEQGSEGEQGGERTRRESDEFSSARSRRKSRGGSERGPHRSAGMDAT